MSEPSTETQAPIREQLIDQELLGRLQEKAFPCRPGPEYYTVMVVHINDAKDYANALVRKALDQERKQGFAARGTSEGTGSN